MAGKNELFVDTAGWACFLDVKHPLQRQVEDALAETRQRGRSLVTSNYIVTELQPLLYGRLHLPHKRILEFINYLYSDAGIDVIHIDRQTHEAAWAMYTQYDDKEWSLVDASSFVIMRERGIAEVLTTDKHFVQAGFTRLPLGQ